ncbi:Uncharacterised protein [Bordetella pertussis]|nr:Uncharacterised protein [Bordetella pertussis]
MVWRSNCSRAWVTIGPRQIAGASASMSRPMELACRPCPTRGSMVLLSRLSGRPARPSMAGTLGP